MEITCYFWIVCTYWLVTSDSEAQSTCSLFESDPFSTLGKFIDPSLVRAFKSKYPKKYLPGFLYDKDLILQAKYRLAEKLLARHLKNINMARCGKRHFTCESGPWATSRGATFSLNEMPVVQQQLQQQQHHYHHQHSHQLASSLQRPTIISGNALKTFATGLQPDHREILKQCLQQAFCQPPGSCDGSHLSSQQVIVPNQHMMAFSSRQNYLE